MTKHKVIFAPLHMLAKLEDRRAYRYNFQEIGEKVGLPRQTIRNVFTQYPQRVDSETLGKLLDFFVNEGLAITLNDLFVITTVGAGDEAS